MECRSFFLSSLDGAFVIRSQAYPTTQVAVQLTASTNSIAATNFNFSVTANEAQVGLRGGIVRSDWRVLTLGTAAGG